MKNTFQGSSGLSRRDEEDLWHERVQNAAFGTFGTIFEIVVPTEFKMHFHVDKIKQLAAVLSDILGNDTMKMAITTTRQAQDILYDTASFPRLFDWKATSTILCHGRIRALRKGIVGLAESWRRTSFFSRSGTNTSNNYAIRFSRDTPTFCWLTTAT